MLESESVFELRRARHTQPDVGAVITVKKITTVFLLPLNNIFEFELWHAGELCLLTLRFDFIIFELN